MAICMANTIKEERLRWILLNGVCHAYCHIQAYYLETAICMCTLPMGYIIGFLIFLLLVSGLMIWFKNREIDNLWIEARSHKKFAVNAVNFFRIADALRK